ncbi:hypothetical protein BC831DRAFT_451173 [Entophlyctis helioformis]|nr:hypothetical protein BC831DRAFT_451173 [Entophlyctis helioformis]
MHLLSAVVAFAALALRVCAAPPQDCIAFYAQRGCVLSDSVCCLGATCETFYQSVLPDNAWPPSIDNCLHKCPFIGSDSAWNCTSMECRDGQPRPSSAGCPASQVCIFSRCRPLASAGQPCMLHTTGTLYDHYDNCSPGLYCDRRVQLRNGGDPSSVSNDGQSPLVSNICMAKQQLWSTCSDAFQCESDKCWAAVCAPLGVTAMNVLVPLACIALVVGAFIACSCLQRCCACCCVRPRQSAKPRQPRRPLQRHASSDVVTVVNA